MGSPLVTELKTIFGKRIPTREWWDSEIKMGWKGSDGSSCSTDTIMGVRIGRTTQDYCILPADVHDYFYRVLRRLLFYKSITEEQAEEFRKAADLQHRKLLLSIAGQAPFGLRTLYRVRCWIRWATLRKFGSSSIQPRKGEIYHRIHQNRSDSL